MSSSVATGSAPACVTPERMKELTSALDSVRVRIRQAAEKAPPELRHINPVLVAVSKYKPTEDVLACFEHGQRDFGENYVAELSEKAAVLPTDIRWHFIGTLQSNKCKPLAAIPNLFAIQTLDTTKKATTLNNALPTSRIDPLHVFIQVNTSSEANKSGLPPISSDTLAPEASELAKLALHVINDCDRLHLRGLMTIGSIEQSTSSGPNEDFSALVYTANALQNILPKDRYGWGVEGKLELSMGMSADFEQAIRAGAGTVRVGTSIFGSRKTKDEVAQT